MPGGIVGGVLCISPRLDLASRLQQGTEIPAARVRQAGVEPRRQHEVTYPGVADLVAACFNGIARFRAIAAGLPPHVAMTAALQNGSAACSQPSWDRTSVHVAPSLMAVCANTNPTGTSDLLTNAW